MTAGAAQGLGPQPDGGCRVDVYCSMCLRRHATTTILLMMTREPGDESRWRWAPLVRRSEVKTRDGRKSVTIPSPQHARDGDRGLELFCQRCRSRPRVSKRWLLDAADDCRRVGTNLIGV